MLIYTLLAAAMAAQIELTQITNPPKREVEISQEVDGFITKPLVAETKITIDPPKKVIKKVSYNTTIVGESGLQCVVWARNFTGNQKVHGWAGALAPEGRIPQVGAIALEPGHVSVVIEVNGDTVRVREANYIRGHITERSVNVASLKGFIY